MNRCRVCDRPLPRNRRVYCSLLCRRHDRQGVRSERSYAPTQGRLDEIAYLLDAGESPDQIAAQLGLTLHATAKWLYRHGHTDLACQFARSAQRERRSA